MPDEPKWPTADEVVEHAHGGPGTAPCYDSAVHAIDMCRAAWLATVDDPRRSPVGEVRQNPNGNYVAIRADRHGSGGREPYPWTAIYPEGDVGGDSHQSVKGWPVIGAVPGTPAAEAQS